MIKKYVGIVLTIFFFCMLNVNVNSAKKELIDEKNVEYLEPEHNNNVCIVGEEVKSIRAEELGIYPETNCASQLNQAMEMCYEKGIETIFFDKGDYYIDKKLLLYPVNLIGAGYREEIIEYEIGDINDTNLSINQEFELVDKKQNKTRFVFDNFSSERPNNGWGYVFAETQEGKEGYYYGTVKNIDWYVNTKKANFVKQDVIFIMHQINECRDVSIENCNYIVEGSEETSRITELWFRQENKINVLIKNCGFINDNYEYLEYRDDGRQGGCLWVWGGTNKEKGEKFKTKDLLIEDCNFLTTCGDEAIAIWETKVDNIQISDCKITNRVANSGNLMALYDLYSNESLNGNIMINNLEFQINTSCTFPFKIFSMHNNVSTYINDFDIDINIKDKPLNDKEFAIRSVLNLSGVADEYGQVNAPTIFINGLNVHTEGIHALEDYKVIYGLLQVSNISKCEILNADIAGDVGVLFENEIETKTIIKVKDSCFDSSRERTTIAIPYGEMELSIEKTKLIDCSSIYIPRKDAYMKLNVTGCLWETDYWLKGINYGVDEIPKKKSKLVIKNTNIITNTEISFYYGNKKIKQEEVFELEMIE